MDQGRLPPEARRFHHPGRARDPRRQPFDRLHPLFPDAGGKDLLLRRLSAGVSPRLEADRRTCPRAVDAISRGLTRFISQGRSEEHTSALQSLMRISYAVFCLKKKTLISLSHPYYT